MLAAAQFAAQHQAVIARHHDVQHDQVDGQVFQQGTHLPAVGRQRDGQAVLLQEVAGKLAYFTIVVDDHHVINLIHLRWPKGLRRHRAQAHARVGGFYPWRRL
ncbi:hypothetical protein D3C73_1029930 [compost metagenome]